MQLTNFIMNLNDLYKPPLTQAQQKHYSEYLMKYTDNQLDELWEATKETHCKISVPTIGELKKYSKDVTPLKVVNPAQLELEERNRLTEQDIFSTPLGKLSLEKGFSASYYIHCKEKGIPDQGDYTLMEFQRGQYAAETAYEECKQMAQEDGSLNVAPALLRFRETQLQRNKELEMKYGY